MNKRPAEQWYTGDWYRAVDVQKCCPATRGIWRDAIDAMTNEQITGKIRGTRGEICRLLRCSDRELQRFVDDNRVHRFANVTVRNEKVTIICRRLYRLYLERKGTKKRVRKYREAEKRKSNAEVTPYSSSSTSSSNIYTPIFEQFWKEYPPRWSDSKSVWKKCDKSGAFNEWKKLSLAEQTLALAKVASVEKSKYTPDARKWLKHKRWEDVEGEKPRIQPQAGVTHYPAKLVTDEQKAEARKKLPERFKKKLKT